MNLLEGTGTRTLLLDAGATGGLAHHAALSDEDDVTVGELLLELRVRSFKIISTAVRKRDRKGEMY